MMMTYEEFEKEMLKYLNRRLKKIDTSYEAVPVESKKVNVVQRGICLKSGKINLVVYLEAFYKDVYVHNPDMDLGAEIRSIIDTFLERINSDVIDFSDRINLKYLVAIVVSYEKNKGFLNDKPHRRFHDLAVAYQFQYGKPNSNEVNGCDVTYELMQHLELTEADLFKIACRNMKGKEAIFNSGNIMYMISNELLYRGAGYILFKDIFRKIAEEKGTDVYIYPSSIHEILVAPADYPVEKALFDIRTINRTDIEPEEFLSDNCYYYSRELDEILFFS